MDKIVTLADTATPETAQAVRLQVDTRKWIAGKMLPKKYGDKAANEVTVNSTVNNVLVMSQDQVRKLQQRHQEALSR